MSDGPLAGSVEGVGGPEHRHRPAVRLTPFRPEDHLSGREVKHLPRAASLGLAAATEALNDAGIEPADIDLFIPHQANLRIIAATARMLDMSMDHVVVTVDRHGNTSAASVPLALDEAVRDGRIQRGDLMLLEAFGGGFTWGSALVRY